MAIERSDATLYRGYRTELDPTRSQLELLRKFGGTARWTYNWGLQRKIEAYRAAGVVPTRFDLEKELVRLKRDDSPWLKEISKCVPQEALKDLEAAFQNFYRSLRGGRTCGFPRFKARRKSGTCFRIGGEALKITTTHIWLARIGWVRLKERGYLPTSEVHYVAVTVRERADKWFVGVTVGRPMPAVALHSGPSAGLDVGLLHLATLSDGTVYDSPRSLRRFDRRLRHADRALSRKQPGSRNWNRARLQLARLHLRVANIRLDANHKITTEVTRAKSLIVIEDFQTANLKRNKRVSRAFHDAAISQFLRQLPYKSQWRGGSVQVAPQFFPSTRMCSACGWINKSMSLAERTYRCDRCGLTIDRDINAAKNLHALAASPADSHACREDVSPYLVAVLDEAGTADYGGGRSPCLSVAIPMTGRRARTAISHVTAA
ncbi:MAG: transposase [Chloroflexota bacterium]|nr:transposase [Chloroflexota bacterium]